MNSKIQSIKQISIREFLARQGVHPVIDKGSYGLYHSPLRRDDTPSFKVDFHQNLWYDFGMAMGGSIIDLVKEMFGCSVFQAIRILEEDFDTVVRIPVCDSSQPDGITLKIADIKQLQHPALLDYLASRGIDIEIAKENCFEVHYERADKQYFAIGFANNSDGWEFRNPHFKGGFSPKDITTRNSGYDKVIVFEGFMDYLAYLTLKGGVAPAADILVLNSVANIKKALPFLQIHSQIKLILDNDDAGRRAVTEVKRLVPGVDVTDCSTSYAPCKDLNDYLLSKFR